MREQITYQDNKKKVGAINKRGGDSRVAIPTWFAGAPGHPLMSINIGSMTWLGY
jgi:hypothetical protein